ncbi:MAG: phosphate signaling complex protein PhoU [Chlorobium sp.]|jgi:phosphate transport system protein|uniref:phosphate signaling complex protein PhoU n=1 Tax=Chlorobium sp. TaxID=1095 RepID=UPI001D1E2567|nr:phosphate signaling complex protein PhoU [Chlorobium sp.]MBN1279056.1 phosphate signaling complex protein PhoU [Chlorobiaceae bacterium]MCF8216829.1 phosphate signaling complex protein PhoU [Chlorobium sp.]MCF8271674.1 phosphate signaling complex protein PhoU [Chlorobium sp.]MCF8288046.1 phosphate signaling complex protein PhoU [Chlorobium sp.]MCF8291630.1 phosphate signaling complex protein PhoU [Chlorobium sp.]
MLERPVHEHISELTDTLVFLALSVHRNLLLALDALKEMDTEKARRVKNADYDINEAEVQLETQCLSFLALQQPVARDLRTIVAIMKINDDIERIGDLSVHIVERSQDIDRELQKYYDLESAGAKVADMLQYAIDAFAQKDTAKAARVFTTEQEINYMYRTIVRNVMASMKTPSGEIEQLIAVLSVSRYLERIADHATKTAREVVHLVTGQTAPRQRESSYEKLFESLRN